MSVLIVAEVFAVLAAGRSYRQAAVVQFTPAVLTVVLTFLS